MTWVLPASLASRKVLAEMMVLYTLHISTWVPVTFPFGPFNLPFHFPYHHFTKHRERRGVPGFAELFSSTCSAWLFFCVFLDSTENSSGVTTLGQDVEQYGAELKEVGTTAAAARIQTDVQYAVCLLCFVLSSYIVIRLFFSFVDFSCCYWHS